MILDEVYEVIQIVSWCVYDFLLDEAGATSAVPAQDIKLVVGIQNNLRVLSHGIGQGCGDYRQLTILADVVPPDVVILTWVFD